MKRIMVVLPELETGGGQRVALEIVRNIKCDSMVIQVVVLYPRQGNILEEFADNAGIDVRYLSKGKGFCPAVIPQIHRAIKEFKPDVIHAHLRVMPYLLIPMCMSNAKQRYYTVHSLAERDATGLNRLALWLAFHLCGTVPVAISPVCQRTISKVYGIDVDKIPCFDQGIDVGRFRRKHPYKDLEDDVVRLIAVGRLESVKNYSLMLDAFYLAHQENPNIELLIIGDGPLRGELQSKVEQYGLDKAVQMPGIKKQVEDYLWQSHIYLMSSDYEGLPLAVLEAMAAGLPIVSTKAGGVVDIVRDHENGILVECGNAQEMFQAINTLVNDRDLRCKFSDKSTVLSQDRDIEHYAEQYAQLYMGR